MQKGVGKGRMRTCRTDDEVDESRRELPEEHVTWLRVLHLSAQWRRYLNMG